MKPLLVLCAILVSLTAAQAKTFQTVCWDQETKQAYYFMNEVGTPACDDKGRVYVGNKGLDCVWSKTPAKCDWQRAVADPSVDRDAVEVLQTISHQDARKNGRQITP